MFLTNNMKKKTCWGMKRGYNYYFLLNVYFAQGTLWQAVSGGSWRSGRQSPSHSGGQTNQQIDLKFWFSKLIFNLFFARVEKSTAFCTLCLLQPKVEISELWFDTKNLIFSQLLGIAATVYKKQWISQLLLKIE